MDRFAKNTKFLRLINGYSQQEIANLLHISRSTYLRMECGKVSLSLDQLSILSTFYSVELDFLITFDIPKYVMSVIAVNQPKNTHLPWHGIQKNIKLLRTTNGLSQEYVASNIHLSRSTYSAYETGCKAPDMHTLFMLATLFDVDIDTIINYDLEPDPPANELT